jgi:TIR domain-containing protein
VADLAAPDGPSVPQPAVAWSASRALPSRIEVFLSHSAHDLEHVALVKRQIEALGVDVYLAEHDLRPGTSIAAKVQGAIEACHALVVLITSNSIDSAFVQQEVGLARAFGKPIVPIVEKGVDTSRLGILRELEYLELDLDRPEVALAKVSASLQPLVLAQVSTVNVSLTIAPPTPPELANALLVLGLGLMLGFLIASWAGSAGSPGAA